jgi:hypothetical protein
MKRFILLFCLISCFNIQYAQNVRKKIDSLQNMLQTAKQDCNQKFILKCN